MKIARSLAVLSALCLPLAAHAVTYSATATFTDLTTAGNVTGTFSPISFNDPPVGGLFNPFSENFGILAKPGSDDDELALTVTFSAPGAGSGSLTGDAEITGRRTLSGDIDWDSAFSTFNLSNGSIVTIALPNFFGAPFNTSLSQCGSNLCGSSALSVYVNDNDPANAPATPEPSSLALFGTGILGMAGAVRRRLTA